MKRRICVITGSRAEYGLLKPLMDVISQDHTLELQILVTGMHLSAEFGSTYKEILKEGFRILAKVEIGLTSDSPEGITRSMGLALSGIGNSLKRLQPDLVVLLGDRFEIFSAAAAAHVHRIPIAHLHGGEITEGAIDDAFRHSITKMSSLHFTSTEEYRKRVIQLGEHPSTVFNVGAIGLDNVRRLKLLSKPALERKLGLKFKKRNLLITYHPVTLEKDSGVPGFKNLLRVLDTLDDTMLIFTKANADTHGRTINELVENYARANADKAKVFASMGQLKYLSTMKYVDAVVGNSSSGIIEAPSFRIGTIDIGARQAGRIRAASLISCNSAQRSISNALREVYSFDFQSTLKIVKNPYGDGKSAKRIARLLKTCRLDRLGGKKFYDLYQETEC